MNPVISVARDGVATHRRGSGCNFKINPQATTARNSVTRDRWAGIASGINTITIIIPDRVARDHGIRSTQTDPVIVPLYHATSNGRRGIHYIDPRIVTIADRAGAHRQS